jgi:hypothetical protein
MDGIPRVEVDIDKPSFSPGKSRIQQILEERRQLAPVTVSSLTLADAVPGIKNAKGM